MTNRAYGCCEYCMSQEKYASQSFSIEHIIPVFSGGDDDLENLALACQGCNNIKFTNRDNLINQRIVYRAYGIHPPKHID